MLLNHWTRAPFAGPQLPIICLLACEMTAKMNEAAMVPQPIKHFEAEVNQQNFNIHMTVSDLPDYLQFHSV